MHINIYIYDRGRPPKPAYLSHCNVSIDKKKKKKKCILSWYREPNYLLRFQLIRPSNNSETCFQFVWLHAHREPAHPFTSHHLSDRRLVISACSAAFGYDPLVASMLMKPIKALFCCSTFESLHRHSSKHWSLPSLLRLKVVYQVYICVYNCVYVRFLLCTSHQLHTRMYLSIRNCWLLSATYNEGCTFDPHNLIWHHQILGDGLEALAGIVVL